MVIDQNERHSYRDFDSPENKSPEIVLDNNLKKLTDHSKNENSFYDIFIEEERSCTQITLFKH